MLDWTTKNWSVIVTVLFLLSELLAQIPSVKANSVFGFIMDLLRGEVTKSKPTVDNLISSGK